MKWLWTLVLVAYCFVVHFGILFRFSSGEEAAFGLSTLLAVLMIITGVPKIGQQLTTNPFLRAFALLFAWIACSSLLSPTGVMTAYYRLAQLVLYLALAAVIASWEFTEKRLAIVFHVISVAVLLSCGLTIIDFMGWVNVPYCNDVSIFAGRKDRIGGLLGSSVEQAGGFFPRRTAMAAFLCLSITSLTILAISLRGVFKRLFYAGAAGTAVIAVFLTHNRSCIISVLFGLVLYVTFTKSLTVQQRVKSLVFGATIAVGVLAVAFIYFPKHVEVYATKLSFLTSADTRHDAQVKGDSLRMDVFYTILNQLTKNPAGNGFGWVPTEKHGLTNPHNIISSWIWAAGAFAIVWLIPFSWIAYRTLTTQPSASDALLPYADALRCSIAAFFLTCMAHEVLATGLAWIFIGILISIQQRDSVLAQHSLMQRYYPGYQIGTYG